MTFRFYYLILGDFLGVLKFDSSYFLCHLSGTVRDRQPEGESPKFEKPQISLSGVATAWGHYMKLKTLLKQYFIFSKLKI